MILDAQSEEILLASKNYVDDLRNKIDALESAQHSLDEARVQLKVLDTNLAKILGTVDFAQTAHEKVTREKNYLVALKGHLLSHLDLIKDLKVLQDRLNSAKKLAFLSDNQQKEWNDVASLACHHFQSIVALPQPEYAKLKASYEKLIESCFSLWFPRIYRELNTSLKVNQSLEDFNNLFFNVFSTYNIVVIVMKNNSHISIIRKYYDDFMCFYFSERRKRTAPVAKLLIETTLSRNMNDLLYLLKEGRYQYHMYTMQEYHNTLDLFGVNDVASYEAISSYFIFLWNIYQRACLLLVTKESRFDFLCEMCVLLNQPMSVNHFIDEYQKSCMLAVANEGQHRLLLKFEEYVNSQIRNFEPSSQDVNSPNLLDNQNDVVSVLENDLGNLAQSAYYRTWYITVSLFFLLIGRITVALKNESIPGVVLDCLEACILSLVKAKRKMEIAEGHLFFIRHMCIIQEQLASFDVALTKADRLFDFAILKSAALELVKHRRMDLFKLSSSNSIYRFLKEQLPSAVVNTFKDAGSIVESEKRESLETFVEFVEAECCESLMSFQKQYAWLYKSFKVSSVEGLPAIEQVKATVVSFQFAVDEVYVNRLRAKISKYLKRWPLVNDELQMKIQGRIIEKYSIFFETMDKVYPQLELLNCGSMRNRLFCTLKQ